MVAAPIPAMAAAMVTAALDLAPEKAGFRLALLIFIPECLDTRMILIRKFRGISESPHRPASYREGRRLSRCLHSRIGGQGKRRRMHNSPSKRPGERRRNAG